MKFEYHKFKFQGYTRSHLRAIRPLRHGQDGRLPGISGKKSFHSKQFQQLFDDIRAGKVNTILVTALDRVCRSVKDFLAFFEILNEHKVEFVCLNEQGFRTKEYDSRRGKFHPARKFTWTGAMWLLTNWAYIGKKEVNKKKKGVSLARTSASQEYRLVERLGLGSCSPPDSTPSRSSCRQTAKPPQTSSGRPTTVTC